MNIKNNKALSLFTKLPLFFFFFLGNYKITEYFLYPVGHLAVDPSIHILIQKEV